MKKYICKIFGHSIKIIRLPSLKYLNRHLVPLEIKKCIICGKKEVIEL
jgi:hypothetical protein